MTDTQQREPSGAERMFGDFAPALVGFTDSVLFGEVWERTDLSRKERSLVTVSALTTLGNTDQLRFHLEFAKTNGPLRPSSSKLSPTSHSTPDGPRRWLR
jgi:4-carboxymuconolactone decarboxylase